MEEKIKLLIQKLKKENDKRCDDINDINISDYYRSVTIHSYKLTIDFIKQLENILN